jgi:hypothetical protein
VGGGECGVGRTCQDIYIIIYIIIMYYRHWPYPEGSGATVADIEKHRFTASAKEEGGGKDDESIAAPGGGMEDVS